MDYTQPHTVTIDKAGRIVIPAAQRKALDIKPGDELTLRIDDYALQVMNRKNAIRAAQKYLRQKLGHEHDSLTESLFQTRREEAAREGGE